MACTVSRPGRRPTVARVSGGRSGWELRCWCEGARACARASVLWGKDEGRAGAAVADPVDGVEDSGAGDEPLLGAVLAGEVDHEEAYEHGDKARAEEDKHGDAADEEVVANEVLGDQQRKMERGTFCESGAMGAMGAMGMGEVVGGISGEHTRGEKDGGEHAQEREAAKGVHQRLVVLEPGSMVGSLEKEFIWC